MLTVYPFSLFWGPAPDGGRAIPPAPAAPAPEPVPGSTPPAVAGAEGPALRSAELPEAAPKPAPKKRYHRHFGRR